MTIYLTSFGYLHGDPQRADITLNVRELFANPIHDDRLRNLDGHDDAVQDRVLACSGIAGYLGSALALIQTVDLLKQVGGHATTVWVGCAGGRHRSVVIVNLLADSLRAVGADVKVIHRDISKPIIYKEKVTPAFWVIVALFGI